MKSGTNENAQFIKVICKKCKAENVIFSRATTQVRCPECNEMHTVPTGGKCQLINCTEVAKYEHNFK